VFVLLRPMAQSVCLTRFRVTIERPVVFAVIVGLEFLAVVALKAAAVPEHPDSGFVLYKCVSTEARQPVGRRPLARDSS